MTGDKPTYTERNQTFIDELKSHPEVRGVEKQSRTRWLLHTDDGSKSVYLHYHKWYKEDAGPAGYFQASWDQTQNATRPLYHVFLGPSDNSVRVVPNDALMSERFTLIRDHNDGKQWRLNVNTDRNSVVLDEYADRSIFFE